MDESREREALRRTRLALRDETFPERWARAVSDAKDPSLPVISLDEARDRLLARPGDTAR